MQTDVDKLEAQLPPDYNLPVLCGSGVGMEWALAASSTSGFQVSRVSRQVDILDSTY